MATTAPVRTERLDLRPVVGEDLDALHALHSDPAVWAHFPAGGCAVREDIRWNLYYRLCLALAWRGPDAADPGSIRLVDADRSLAEEVLAPLLRHQ